ncbi:hypothetical protein PUN28_005161 [Cardiocondyla obscurior]|uniref:Uncharacterized protein n=1 Tax=Cardiocondyla obscurior TaxID=286306 RepID=A0AAW2GHI7_9HYME
MSRHFVVRRTVVDGDGGLGLRFRTKLPYSVACSKSYLRANPLRLGRASRMWSMRQGSGHVTFTDYVDPSRRRRFLETLLLPPSSAAGFIPRLISKLINIACISNKILHQI